MIEPSMILIIILFFFIVFLILVKKVVKILINTLIIVVASVIFPVLMNFFGFPIALTMNNILFFMAFGIALYVVYLFGKLIYSSLTVVEKSARAVAFPITALRKSEKKKMEQKMKKFIKEKEKKE